MEFELEFGGDPQDVTITLRGDVDAAGLQAVNAALVAHPEFRAGLAMLVDVSQLTTAGAVDAFEDATDAIGARDWEAAPLAVAIVAPNDPAFRAALLWRAYFGGSQSRREVFRTIEDAQTWLRAERQRER